MANGKDAARAIDALRRGWVVRLSADDGAIRLMAIEGADAVTLAGFDPDDISAIPGIGIA